LTRSAASWSQTGWQWLQNRLAIREDANRRREEGEQRRARERAAGQGKGSIFDTEAKALDGVDELEVLEEAPGGRIGVAQRETEKVLKQPLRVVPARPKKKVVEQTGKTAMFKMSHRKLNKLAHQIGGKPIDHAILQMQFSSKRASTRIKSMLALARDQAADRGLRRERLVVTEAYVNKGPKQRRMDIKGRGRFGIKHHPSARMCVVLKEGKTRAEKKEEELTKRLRKVRSAGLYREDVPIRNHGPVYTW